MKYRRRVFDSEISDFAKEMFTKIGSKYNISLVEWNHDKDHIHILFKAHPNSECSKFINAYKSTSSRLLKRDFPRYYRVMSEKLAKAQCILSKRKKRSARWNKQRLVVAKLQEKVANQRMNFLHHKSKELASAFDAVVIEDLNMKGLSQALRFGKGVHDNGLGDVHYFLSIQAKRTRETACGN